MRLLIVTSSLNIGGAERLAVQLANGFHDLRDNVEIFTCIPGCPLEREVNNNITVSYSNYPKVSLSLASLVRKINIYKPDVIFCSQVHLSVLIYFAVKLSQFRNSVQIIVRESSTPSKNIATIKNPFKKYLLKLLSSLAYRVADILVAPGKAVKKDIEKYYKIRRDIKVMVNPMDYSEIIEKSNLTNNHTWFSGRRLFPVLVAVGRLTQAKDYSTLIKAMEIVSKYNNAKLIIVGEGEERKNLEALIEELDLSKNIDMPGFDLNPYSYIKRADLFVLSSIYEGMPNSLIQAILLNKEIVSTDFSGSAGDLLEKDRLVKVGDHVGLAKKIIEILKGDTQFSKPKISTNDVSVKSYCEELKKLCSTSLSI